METTTTKMLLNGFCEEVKKTNHRNIKLTNTFLLSVQEWLSKTKVSDSNPDEQ